MSSSVLRDRPEARDRVDTAARPAAPGRRESAAPARQAAFAAVGVALALCVYRPWAAVPLQVRDLADVVPTFIESRGVAEGFRRVVAQYMGEGRFMPVTMAMLQANWLSWGWDPAGWQWTKSVLMLVAAFAAFALLRRLAAGAAGAAVGVALFVVSGAAASAWLQPQIWDVVGVLLVIGATRLAMGWRRSRRPRATALVTGLALALAAMVTEPFVACVPFVLLVAMWRRDDGSMTMSRPTRDDLIFAATVILTTGLLVGLPRLAAQAMATESSYAARYDLSAVTLARAYGVLRAAVLPATRVPLFPANVAFVVLILMGVASRLSRGGERREAAAALLIAISLPLTGALLYAPWPGFSGYYAYKLLPGVALLVALAVTWIQRYGTRASRAGGVVASLVLLVFATLVTRNAVEAFAAEANADAAAAHALRDYARYDSVLVATDDPVASGELGHAMRAYAAAHGDAPLPAVRDVACAAAERALADGGAVVIAPQGQCRVLARGRPPDRQVQFEYTVRSWKTLRGERAVAAAGIWAPPPPSRQ